MYTPYFVDLLFGLHYNVIMQSINARAKINFALNVVGREEKMHLLDGLYATCRLGDKITLSARSDKEVTVRYVGRDGMYEKDSAYFAAKLLQKEYGTPGVDIVIEKNIAELRGLGGSSADAAGVSVAFSREFGLGKIDEKLLLKMGSDVPFQYEGGYAEVSGKGEKITKVALPKMHVVLLCPPEGVSTAECFSLYDRVGGENGDIGRFIESLKNKRTPVFFNALERAATKLVSGIGDCRKILENAGFDCGMTGSGSAMFGIEYEERDFRKKMKKVIVPAGYTLTETVTEG